MCTEGIIHSKNNETYKESLFLYNPFLKTIHIHSLSHTGCKSANDKHSVQHDPFIFDQDKCSDIVLKDYSHFITQMHFNRQSDLLIFVHIHLN